MTETQKTLMGLYALVGAGSIMAIIPLSMIPMAGFTCVLVGFVSAYIYRWRHKSDQLYRYHCSYIIRTIWISSLVLTIGVVLFGSIIFLNADMMPIDAMMKSAERGVLPTDYDIYAMQNNFVQLNRGLIIFAAVVGFFPYSLYLIYRIFSGVRMLSR